MAEKSRPEHLAIFGAPPSFSEPLHVGRPNVPDRARLMARLGDALDRRWLTNDGPYVRELERRVAERLHVEHAVAVANGTLGLALAAVALDLRGEVIVPALTFVGTAHALRSVGLRPVFADVDSRTYTLDPAAVAAAATPATSAIFGVHLWGRTCDVEALNAMARPRGLALAFDAAHAFGCRRGARPVGGFGDIEVFSLHATKIVNALEGAVVTTRDAGLARRLAALRNFGFEGYDRVAGFGVNAKMNEVSAAMALGCLEELDDYVAAGAVSAARYEDGLAGLPGVSPLAPSSPDDVGNNHHFVVELDATRAGLDRDDILEVLWAENIRARRYFYPGCHRMEPYQSERETALPVTDAVLERVLQLPAGAAVSPGEVDVVAAVLRTVLSHADAVRARVRERRAAGTLSYGARDAR
jgi:dTDP-4-amino-4,6-dideoxygalactose transaminase